MALIIAISTGDFQILWNVLSLSFKERESGKWPLGLSDIYRNCLISIIAQLWLTSHPRSTVVLLDTGTPGTSREIFSEDADGEIRTRNPSVINRVL